MRAYNMSMLIIFVNAGYAIVNQLDIFGSKIADKANIWTELFGWLDKPLINIPIIGEVNGVLLLSAAIVGATVVILNTNVELINDRGVAIGAFGVLFYGSIFMSGYTVFSNIGIYGLSIFYDIYVLACTLIFIITVIQMPTGGQKAYV